MRTIEEAELALQQVDAAILAIATGAQSYTVGSRSVTKANLAELRKLKLDLVSEIGMLQGGATRVVGWRGR